MVDAALAFSVAARKSPGDVFLVLERWSRRIEPSIDVFAMFVPDADVLTCAYAAGSRAEPFLRSRVAFADADACVARCAVRGHRVDLREGVAPAFPGDRSGAAMALVDGTRCIAVAYASSLRSSGFGSVDELARLARLAAPPPSPWRWIAHGIGRRLRTMG
ncbi:MAG: hypothetical protein M3Y18_00660 [Candidatus Eremiobacteraeota bacterium]|nr:hypothetical protein [Candidatus Eremiobacteraeota bacterium]